MAYALLKSSIFGQELLLTFVSSDSLVSSAAKLPYRLSSAFFFFTEFSSNFAYFFILVACILTKAFDLKRSKWL